jgi:integrase
MAAVGIDREQIAARHLTYHGLRHTYITLGRMAGINDLEIQALAGHKSGRMMERYSHVMGCHEKRELHGIVNLCII